MVTQRFVIVLVVITVVNIFVTLIMPSPRVAKEPSAVECQINPVVQSQECTYAISSVNTWIDVAKECAQALALREEELMIARAPEIEL